MTDKKVLAFTATVQKVQTLVDQGIRVTLDLSEQEIQQAAVLMECKRAGIVLQIEASACKTEGIQNDALDKRTIRQP